MSMRLVAGGELEDARVIAHAARRDAGVPDHAIGEEVLTTAAEMKASFVVWSHTGRLAIADELLTRLKTLPSRPVLAYWDNDMYQRFYKPFPAAALRVARRCDVVFVCGASAYVDHLHRHGCRDIRYTPSSTDEERFGLMRECDSGAFSGDLDVVLVGNRVSRRPVRAHARRSLRRVRPRMDGLRRARPTALPRTGQGLPVGPRRPWQQQLARCLLLLEPPPHLHVKRSPHGAQS